LARPVSPQSGGVAWGYGSFLLPQKKLKPGFEEIRCALENDPSLTTDAVSECCVSDSEENEIVQDASLRNSTACLVALNYFVSQGHLNAAEIVWRE
jgi:hypothetical protein